ncbi:hypothetical protein CA223_07225 [Sphingomonas koreensis]|jgi:fibronectin-binding autotransporter adhesin|uniref:Autotransporter domain-containing protein n=1 Tax=Sphingomonas koreensis TaxID=93064 RepID=A0A1L6J7J5_9SPHN|nr:autotransporter-associated beta strand repeat-containing protein [Sphingomonas koreensis]APR51923.1 hypothetical protein BRX40_05255 [Sphingomonas koreensis]MDC7812462.1 autotransporter-associated beta strand repeat-containing protein [Sphingomonas koreensis]RSU22726.1 hypothetical protein CA224_04875 [Sphingomonas koreensis]RSU30800.1 hypothetical protein CA222_01670 [Sphingomonas koreensis]RSU31895.1 hypothetical protein CA225_00750 [Sphingomonas koreensis]
MGRNTASFVILRDGQRKARRNNSYRTRTALASGLAATVLLATSAAAQDTRGGDGGLGNVMPGPPGGASSTTGTGGAGGNATESYEGGAGGGAGRVGGQGGNTSTGITGGAGGATPGAYGANGTGGGTGSRATGGGGGAHGAVLNSMAFLGGAISGGNGGNGGTSNDGDGGGGGAGGYGVVIDANVAGTFSFSVAIAGGDGGLGGNGYFWGGGGGDGGHGLVFATAASAELNAPVSGGNAGYGGTFLAGGCCNRGNNGAGGIGVVGRDATLTINAAVSGGLNGDGVTRALALSLGGTSRLSLGSGWSLSGDIRIVDGRLNFLQDSDLTLGNAISGGGMLIKSGTGILTLSGTNSYTGGTRVEAGTLSMGSAAALGSGGVDLAGGTLDLRSNSFDLARGITGTGTLIASSGGSITVSGTNSFGSSGGGITSNLAIAVGSGRTLTLLGNNDLTGGITLAGRLVIGQTGAAGGSGNTITTTGSVISYANGTNNTANINIASNSTQLEVQAGAVATQSGVISQDASPRGFEKIGNGTLILSAANSYTGTTVISAGILGLGVDGAAGTGTIMLADTARLLNASCGCVPLTLTNAIQIALGGTATIDAGGYQTVLSGAISGGNLVLADTFGGGITTVTGSNSYGNTTVAAGATLQVGDGGTTGTLGTGSITTDGMLAFNRSDDVTLATAIGGNGLLGQFGAGKLILTANNSYSGGTLILNPDGTIQVGDGGTTGALGTGQIVIGGGTLIFNRSDDITVADSIAGDGLITKLGAGTLTLSGDNLNGMTGPYVGNISVQAGTLAVGQFGLGASQRVEIDNGATLKALEDSYSGDMAILSGGGTIDTGSYTLEMIGALDLQGELTKIGSGTLLLDDLNEEGAGSGGINVTAGTLGLGSDFAAGTGLIKLANGTTLLNAACGCARLNIDNAIQIALGGTATFDGGGNNTDLNAAISGGDIHFTTSISAPFAGSIFRLNGANSYGHTQIGPNVALIVYDGTLGTGNVTFDAAASDPTTPAALVFQTAADYSFSGRIIGNGIVSIETEPANIVTLTGSNTSTEKFTGSVDVISGRLVINGNFGDVVGNTARMTLNGGSLAGSGIFHGSIDLGNAALNPGNSPGTLNIAGNLNLGAGTILNFELGAPGVVGGASNDLVNVGGNLTLDGTLNTIGWGAGYGPGYYRLINYGGTLTDNGLAIGSIAGGLGAQVLTDINGQVNLRLGGAQAIQYWDGGDLTGSSAATGGNGGAGIWSTTSTNWTGPTGYAVNGAWENQVGVFAGVAGGIISVDGNHAFQELRFETDGYVLRPFDPVLGATLQTTGGFSIIDVSAGVTADIGVVIQGGAGLDKTGTGTLVLSAANTYSGATDIAAGTLRLGTNNAIGNQSALNVQSGALFDLAGFTTHAGSLEGAGNITLNNGRLEVGYNNASTMFSGTITGPDGGTSDFTKNGSGTLTLSGTINVGHNPTLEAIAQVNNGTLRITGTGSLSADLIQNFSTIENSGTINAGVILQSFASLTNTGTITGTIQNFATFDNYGTIGGLQSLSGTTINHGTGVINGSVQTFASFTSTGIINGSLSNFSTAQIQNQVNGELANVQNGAIVTLTGTTTGITNYSSAQGALLDLAGFNTTVGALNGAGGDIRFGGATLTVDMSSIPFADYSGAITGPGLLVKTGSGEQVLRGTSINAPIIHVDAGILTLADTGAFNTDVTVASGATFNLNGALGGYVTNSGTLNLAGTGSINSVLLLALINNSGGVTHAAGTLNAGVQNAGAFFVDGPSTGATSFDQAAGGQLTLNTDFAVGMLTGSGGIDTGFSTLSITGNGGSYFDGVISGNGGLTKAGTGILTLNADNSYAGPTTVSDGTLIVGVFGAVTGQVINNATFESAGTLRGGLYNDAGATARLRGQADGLIENHGTVTLTGSVFGNGMFEQAASGTFNLAGFTASFGALAGAGSVDLGAGGLFVGAGNSDASFAGTIIGSGNFTKTGTGTLTLTGVSTYGGPTQILGGTLRLADSGAIGAGNVHNDATLAFDAAVDRSFGNTISGNGGVTKSGTGLTTLTGTNSYWGGTAVLGGSLGFDNGQALGNGAVTLADGTRLRNVQGVSPITIGNAIQVDGSGMATLQGVDGSSTTFNGAISGGTVHFGLSGGGATAFTLGTANSYGDTRIGGGVALTIGNGTLGSGNVLFEASGSPSSLTFANGLDYRYGGTISGAGSVIVDTAASNVAVTLTGSNTVADNFTGTVTVATGRLVLDGNFGDVVNNSASMTLNGGSLSGSGTFHGDLTFGSAELNPGNSPGTLNIAGNLTLGAGTILNFELGEAGTPGGANNDLVNVGGNLTLDGTLNVIAQPSFGEGYYRLFNYGGSLTDSGLLFGSLPGGYTPTLLTNIAGQVNLLFASSPQAIQYWDGGDLAGGSAAAGGDGGSGVWSGASTNWTAPTGYAVNDGWRGQVAVFGGASGGNIAVQGTQAFQELRFSTGGYTIAGATAADGLATTGGFSVVDVFNGVDATINARISGSGGLTKTGDGTLNLGGANSYAGVTTVSGGTLNLTARGSLAGAVVNDSMFNNAGTIAGLVTNNAVMTSTGTLNGGLNNRATASISGVLNGMVTNSGTITLTGVTTGIGAVTQSGTGRFELNGHDTGFGSLAGAGTVTLGGATLTLGGNNASTSFGGVIGGSGNVTKIGTGTLTLTGASGYTGITTISAGTLMLASTGELQGAVHNNANFENAGRVNGLVTNTGDLYSTGTLAGGLSNSGTAAIAGTLTGAVTNTGVMGLVGSTSGIGTVTQTAGSSFYLNGFSTSIDSLTGAGTVLTGGATLTLNGGGISSFGGSITGSGGLIKAGTGSVTLTGANSHTGTTTVAGGTLAVSATGSLAGAVLNQANFTNAGTVAGMVRNDAMLTSTGTLAGGLLNNGTASLAGTIGNGMINNGAATFTGAATIAALQQDGTGTLDLAGFGVSLGTLSGAGAINLGTGALTIGNGNSSYGGTVSGTGSLTKTGTGTLVLTGTATHTGGTTISGGALQIGTGGAAGSLAGAIINNGLLVVSRSDAVTLSNAVSGTGGFVQAGAGTTTLTGANSYTGGTLVSTGRLRGDTASLQGAIQINSTLEFAQTSTGAYGGSLSGAGAFEKTGAGMLNLVGNSATFTGATNVIGGGLALNGLLSRSVITVSNGATLSGTGTAGGLVAQSGGTIAPGNSVGTLNVTGNVLFQTGSLFAAEVHASGSDRIQATGTAALGGTLQIINLGGTYAFNSTYVLLRADAGVSGTFTVANLSSFGLIYRPKIIYTANEVQLFLAPNQLSAVLGNGVPLTYNQASTIGRIDAAVMTGGYDPTPLSALYSLSPAAIPAALDQLSGEIYAGATRAALEDERVVREAVLSRLGDAAAMGLSGNSAWGQAIGSWGNVSSDGNAAGYDIDRKGFLMGIDTGDATEEGSWRAGVLGQYTSITVPAPARGSRATIERTGGGVYAGAVIGGWRVRTAATVSVLDLKAERTIVVPGLTTSVRGKARGVMLQTLSELSYRFETGANSFVEPYLAGSASRVTFGRFVERGGPATLMVGTQKSVLGIGELGLRGEVPLVRGETSDIRLGGNVGLRAAFGDRAPSPAIALAAAPSQAFDIRSATIDRFAAVANVNVTADVTEKLSLRIGYSGLLGSGAREHGVRVALSLAF